MREGRVVSVGECMVELSPAGDGLYRLGFAGDTFNMAWYIRRRLPAAWRVSYVTCVGAGDPLSERLAAFVAEAGLEADAIRTVPGRTVGLYLIDLADGERSFTYWRGQSAARLLAAEPAWLAGRLAGADLVLLSGITAAIVEPEDRPRLLEALREARATGATIAFDPNIRPRLWPDATTMCATIEAFAAMADIVLPSYDDERTHFGDASPEATLARYRGLGAGTIVVKNGVDAIQAWNHEEGATAFTPAPATAVDTTAAGDSFNAAFLAARLQGAGLADAIAAGARLASAVIMHPGALVPAALEAQ